MAIKDAMRLRKDGVYEMQITLDGKRRSFSSRDPDEVLRKMLDAKAREARKGKFEVVAEAWWAEHSEKISYGSVGPYQRAYNHAVDWFTGRDVADITAGQCNAYILSLAKLYASKTVSNHLSVLNMIFVRAVIAGLIEQNPCQYVRVPAHLRKTTRQALTEEQYRLIKNSTGPDSLLARLILYTGARCGEALALQWRDIDFKGKTVTISKSVCFHGNVPVVGSTKTEAGVRTVPLLAPLEAALKPLKGLPEEYVIGGLKPLSKSTLECYWVRYTRDLGLAHYTTKDKSKKKIWRADIDRHQIRHEYATVLFECNIDPEVAQVFMGHTDIHTTRQIYTHIRQRKIDDAAKKLNAHFAEPVQSDTDEPSV